MNTQAVVRRLLIVSFLSVFVCSLSAQDQQGDSAFFVEKEHRLGNYQKDFLNFAQYSNNHQLEYEIALDLRMIAAQNSDRLAFAHTLLEIYNSSRCTNDHALAQFFMRTSVDHFAKQIEQDLKGVDLDLANTRIPGVSQTAISMKNDLREVEEKLEAMTKD